VTTVTATATKEQIFEYVIVLHPTDKDRKDGKHAEIVAGPNVLLARDIEVAKTRAIMELAKKDEIVMGTEDRLEVAVRPFCEG
jgi:hypothetical protein